MANELSAFVELAGGSIDDLLLTPVESLHGAIAGRVYGALGPIGKPARFFHDRAARAVYGAVRSAAGVTTTVTAASVNLVTGQEFRLLGRSRRGRIAISALNALAGDVLEERGNELAIEMSIATRRAEVPCDRAHLRASFPKARGRVAVFVHGLGQTPDAWQRRRHQPFGERLRRDLGMTPVYVKYNSGLHISENGRRLSELLEGLVTAWPVPVRELVLIGHSMGGLVVRSACHAGQSGGRAWPARVKHLVALGSPHTGVPLEKLVHAAAWALRMLPEGRPLAGILDRRSAGIRDLRFGYLVEDDWRGELPGRLLHDHRSDVPPLAGCTHTFISASLSRDPRHPLGWLAGDMLVRSASAAGRRADGSVAVLPDHVFHVGPLTHFDLLDHPLVYQSIRRVIAA